MNHIITYIYLLPWAISGYTIQDEHGRKRIAVRSILVDDEYRDPVYICEGERYDLDCGSDHRIFISQASYGRGEVDRCNNDTLYDGTSNCLQDLTHIVKGVCEDEKSCTLLAGGSDPCTGTFINYLCIDYYCYPNSKTCLSSPCLNGATCQDRNTYFLCKCASGYAGKRCEIIACPSALPEGCRCYSTQYGVQATDSLEITCVWLTGNLLPQFPYSRDITTLNIHQCKFKEIENNTFENFPNLWELSIPVSQKLADIQSNAFSHFTGIERITVSTTQVTTIVQGLFKDLLSLTHIDLHANQISIIEKGAFSNLPALQSINLQNNNIGCDDRVYIPKFDTDYNMWALWGVPKDCNRLRRSYRRWKTKRKAQHVI